MLSNWRFSKGLVAAAILFALLVVVTLGLTSKWRRSGSQVAASSTIVDDTPVLIGGVDEPAELRVKPFPIPKLSPEMHMLGQVMDAAEQKPADPKSTEPKSAGPNNSDPKTEGQITGDQEQSLLQGLNRVLQQYPKFGDAYAMRASLLCERNGDRGAILSDIENTNRYSSEIPTDGFHMLQPIRAKLDHLSGNDAAAIGELFDYIIKNPSDAMQFSGSGATAPERTASTCVWSATDLEQLMERFPGDSRPYLLAGLYYAFFTEFDGGSFPLASKNFAKAVVLDPTSPLPHYFAAMTMRRATLLKPIILKEQNRQEIDQGVLLELNNALKLDPNFLPAVRERAAIFESLKLYGNALRDYDHALAIDPEDSGEYNDRGLLKMETGNAAGAIADFTKAIKCLRDPYTDSYTSHHYENRGDAYLNVGDWKAAADDYTKALSFDLSGSVVLMSIKEFRAIYPEYNSASDEAIIWKLLRTFHGNFKYADYSKDFLQTHVQHPWESYTSLTDLYMKRADAFLKGKQFHHAAIDYRRINGSYPTRSESEQWRRLDVRQNVRTYIDLQHFDDSEGMFVELMIKEEPAGKREYPPYRVIHYRINCSTRHIQQTAIDRYSGPDNLIGSDHTDGNWQAVSAGSLEEYLTEGACSD